MLPTGRVKASSAPLAPPWAAGVAVAALLAGSLLAALVWHATRLDRVDAWVLRWQELANSRADALATLVAATLKPVVVATMVAGTLLGWLVRRRDLTVLALVALPVTLAAEVLLKWVVHRQWEGDPDLLFPSGHAAMAMAAALIAVLAVRVTAVPLRLRPVMAWTAASYVVAIVVARLVETVHSLTDLLGGAALGLVVTLGMALAITAWCGADASGSRPTARRCR